MNNNTTLEVNLKNFEHNYNEIKAYLPQGTEIMPILKDNAYGTYINTKIDLLNKLNIKIIGVANVDEGIKMRELGLKKEILILNQPFLSEIDEIAQNDLITGCSSIEFLQELKKHNAHFNIHIEIDTGMGRTGIAPQKISEYIKEIKSSSNITISGIYTHFACSDSSKKYTQNQISQFNAVVKTAKQEFPTIKYIHASNSAGILNYPQTYCNTVRPGIILYGHFPANRLEKKLNLKPVTKLKSKISYLKEVPKGTSISYGKTYTTKHPTKIATIPIGYSSGVRRSLSNKANIVINGKTAPIIGTICMDALMADVTNIESKINDEIFIWDNEIITLEAVAKNCKTITYEILTGIPEKIKREFIN